MLLTGKITKKKRGSNGKNNPSKGKDLEENYTELSDEKKNAIGQSRSRVYQKKGRRKPVTIRGRWTVYRKN